MESSSAHVATARLHPLQGSHPVLPDMASMERLLDAPAVEWAPGGVAPFARVHLDLGRTLFHEGARLTALYLVESGAAKIVRTEDDGYEQVCEFAGAGDLLGVESMFSGSYAHSVVALTPLALWSIPFHAVSELRQRFRGFDQQLKAQLCQRVGRLEGLVWQMSAIGAERRLARFIVRTVEEVRRRGEPGEQIRLPMSRRDIASHLGLAHESISRALTSLAARNFLSVDRRDLRIHDLDGIADFARCTRGGQDDDGMSNHTRTRSDWRPAVTMQELWRDAA